MLYSESIPFIRDFDLKTNRYHNLTVTSANVIKNQLVSLEINELFEVILIEQFKPDKKPPYIKLFLTPDNVGKNCYGSSFSFSSG